MQQSKQVNHERRRWVASVKGESFKETASSRMQTVDLFDIPSGAVGLFVRLQITVLMLDRSLFVDDGAI